VKNEQLCAHNTHKSYILFQASITEPLHPYIPTHGAECSWYHRMQAKSLRWKQLLLFFLRRLVLGMPAMTPADLQKPGILCQADVTWLSTSLLAFIALLATLHMCLCACVRFAAWCCKWRPPGWSTGILATARPEAAVCLVVLPGVACFRCLWRAICLSLPRAIIFTSSPGCPPTSSCCSRSFPGARAVLHLHDDSPVSVPPSRQNTEEQRARYCSFWLAMLHSVSIRVQMPLGFSGVIQGGLGSALCRKGLRIGPGQQPINSLSERMSETAVTPVLSAQHEKWSLGTYVAVP
jgi:hypothetical protein